MNPTVLGYMRKFVGLGKENRLFLDLSPSLKAENPFFVSTYPPIECGIALYTKYLLEKTPGEWYVVSFNPSAFGSPTMKTNGYDGGKVDYVIDKENVEYSAIPESIERMNGSYDSHIIIFQHSFDIWKNNSEFAGLVRSLHRKNKSIGSFHSIHFQSNETESGLELKEKNLLYETLPELDGVILFSDGAYEAVAQEFPEYKDKLTVIRLGVPERGSISQSDARRQLLEELYKTNADIETLRAIQKNFESDDTIVIGDPGFISPTKNHKGLYTTAKILRSKYPDKKIVAMYAGDLRLPSNERHKEILNELKDFHDGDTNIYLPGFISEGSFHLLFKAVDVNYFWIDNCTQSARLSDAQSMGAAVAGRDLEGLGETLKLSGCPAPSTYDNFLNELDHLISDSSYRKEMEIKGHKYANTFSYTEQAQKHLILIDGVNKRKVPKLDKRQFSNHLNFPSNTKL